MRFIEPVIRPRPLLWAAAFFGLALSYFIAVDSSVNPLSRLLTPFVFPAGLALYGMILHGVALIFLRSGTAGPLGCPELLPTDDVARSWTERTEWSRRNALLKVDPLGLLAVMAWFPPEPVSWRDQIALTKLIWWRPLPALLIAPALIGCMFVVSAWLWMFGSAPSAEESQAR